MVITVVRTSVDPNRMYGHVHNSINHFMWNNSVSHQLATVGIIPTYIPRIWLRKSQSYPCTLKFFLVMIYNFVPTCHWGIACKRSSGFSRPGMAPTECSVPEDPDHGFRIGTNSSIGSVMKFGCLLGYTLTGPASMECQSNGEWSGKAPTCDGKITQHLMIIHTWIAWYHTQWYGVFKKNPVRND